MLNSSSLSTANGCHLTFAIPSGPVSPESAAGNNTNTQCPRKGLSRHGVDDLLQECVQRAVVKWPSLVDKTISPHLIRHYARCIRSKQAWISRSSRFGSAMKAFKQRMDMEADLATKELMLAKVTPAGQSAQRFKADDALLRFLSTLG